MDFPERFDVIVAPGRAPTNRFNVLPTDDYAALAADGDEAAIARRVCCSSG